MTDETILITPLHQKYCDETRLQVPLSMSRMFSWNAWRQEGFTIGDLEQVIRFLRHQVRIQRKWESCLHFRNLIQNVDAFGEYLAQARAMARIPKTEPAKQAVLVASGRPKELPGVAECLSANEVMRRSELLRKLKEFRESL